MPLSQHRTMALPFIILILMSSFAQNPVAEYVTAVGTSIGLRPSKQKCWAGFFFGPSSVTNGGIAGGTFSYDFDGRTLRSNFTVMMTDIACFNDGGGLANGMVFYQPTWEYRIMKDGGWLGLGSRVIYDNVVPANLTECRYDSSMKAFQSISAPIQILPIQISESGSYHFQIQAQLCCNDALHSLAGLYKYRYWTDWSYSYSFPLDAVSSIIATRNTNAFSTNTFMILLCVIKQTFPKPIDLWRAVSHSASMVRAAEVELSF